MVLRFSELLALYMYYHLIISTGSVVMISMLMSARQCLTHYFTIHNITYYLDYVLHVEQSINIFFYKRFTHKDSVNLYYLAHNWMSNDAEGHTNLIHTNFDLYSTLDDALNGSNPWAFCNYDDLGIGMFRNCGVNGSVSGQWTAATKGDMAQFYIYTPKITVREYKATNTSFGGNTTYDFTHLTRACASLAGDWVPARIETMLQNAAAWEACLKTSPTICFLDIVRDNVLESNWYYSADESYDSSNAIDFLYWDDGEPGTGESCVTIYNGDHWHDMGCLHQYPVLCMRSSELYSSDTLHPTQIITIDPTVAPNDEATIAPTSGPNVEATIDPTVAPNDEATIAPTSGPNVEATIDPTVAPNDEATIAPTSGPNVEDTIDPRISQVDPSKDGDRILFIVAICVVLTTIMIAVVWCSCALYHGKHDGVLKIENHIDNKHKGEISVELSVISAEGVRQDNVVAKIECDNVVPDDNNQIEDTTIANGEFIVQDDGKCTADEETKH
eukprot:498939_1